VYQPIRVAITGTTISPGIFDSLAALGRERSVGRIERSLDELKR
jgi:glutamyl-tRNA synthetase